MKNFNFNMGRYHAWQNLTKYIKSAHKKYFRPIQEFKFTYIEPKVNTKFKYLPFDEWKANKRRKEGDFKYGMLGLGFISFLIGRFIYRVLQDQEMGYHYHVRYPVLSKAIQLIAEDLREYTNPFFDITPKNRYQIGQIYPKLYELVVQTKAKDAEHDRKAVQLKKAMEQYDKKIKE